MTITGTKLWVAGEEVTAANVNQYLMRGVKVFADASTRTAAYGGTGEPTLAEGEVTYLRDTDKVEVYNGSAWVPVSATVTGDDDQIVLGAQIFS